MIFSILARLYPTNTELVSAGSAWPAGLPLSQLTDEIRDLQMMGQSALVTTLADKLCVSPEEASEQARLLLSEYEDQTDHSGTGRLVIGKKPDEKHIALHFRGGVSTGMATIHLPCSPPLHRNGQSDVFAHPVRLLLVNLRSPDYPLMTSPLGIITLGGYARRRFGNRVAIEYLDLQLDSDERLLQTMDTFEPHVIGLSVMTGAHDEMHRVLDTIKQQTGPDGPLVVLGNVVPTYAFEEIHHRHRDPLCVVGRGEPAIDAIVRHIGQRRSRDGFFEIPNCSFVEGSIIYQIGGQHFDLGELGVPEWAELFERYPPDSYQEVWLEASRGCPQKKNGVGCSFCAIMPNNLSRDWISRPLEIVVDEIRVLADLGVRHLRFADEEFMAGQTRWSLDIAERFAALKKEMDAGGRVMPTFDFAARVDDISKGGGRENRPQWDIGKDRLYSNNDIRRLALERFRDAGLTQVYLGLESGSLTHLKRLYKAVRPVDNRNAIDILSELGIQIAGGWIMIDPLMEGIREIQENIAFLEETRLVPRRVEDNFVTSPINRLRVLEGSPFVDLMRREGLLGRRMENLVEYEFRYKDPLIGRIDQALQQWTDEVKPLMYALKNAVANDVLNRRHSTELDRLAGHFFRLKRLNYEFLKAIIDKIDAQRTTNGHIPGLANIVTAFRAERRVLLCRFISDLDEGLVSDDAGTLRSGLRQSELEYYGLATEDLAA